MNLLGVSAAPPFMRDTWSIVHALEMTGRVKALPYKILDCTEHIDVDPCSLVLM